MLAGNRPIGEHPLNRFQPMHFGGQAFTERRVDDDLRLRALCGGRERGPDLEEVLLNALGERGHLGVLADGASEPER